MANYEENTQKVILEFEQNSRGECIRVSEVVGKTSGKRSVDIRRYYTNKDGELAPTIKGIRFNAESIDDVIKALNDMKEAPQED